MEPFVPHLLLVADTATAQDECARLKKELSAAGLPLQHCASVGEAGDLCGSFRFDCAVVDENFSGSLELRQDGRLGALPRIVLTTPGVTTGRTCTGRNALSWREASVDRLLSAVRRLLEGRGSLPSPEGDGVGRSAPARRLPPEMGAPTRLRESIEQLKSRFAQVESVFENLRSLSSLEQSEALVEIALFVQNHEEVIGAVWASVSECERALGRLEPVLDPDPGPSEEPTTWVGPLVQDKSLKPPPLVTEEPVRRRVLVVDDDPCALRAFRRVLQSSCDVLTARDGGEALSVVMGQEVDVVSCDLSMPMVNGTSFFNELSELKPELTPRVIFCTGATPSDETNRFLHALPNTVLRKPVDARDLLHTIERLCAGKPTSRPF